MYTDVQKMLTKAELVAMLAAADHARIGLIGDLCLDMYWVADMKLSELSRETPHYPLPVVEERYAPGGAGNAASNIAALKPRKLCVVGLIGEDWRGDLLLKALKEQGIPGELIVRDASTVTNTYIKPLRHGISNVVYEDPRLDFENRKPINGECERKILAALETMAEQVDVVCVSDQMKFGCITDAVRAYICQLGREGKTVIVDSRDRIGLYDHVIVKPNEVEAVHAFGDAGKEDLESLSVLASKLSVQNECPTLMTLGEKGCFVAEKGTVNHCPACPVESPIDFCGAGDTFLAGFGTMLAAGADPVMAAQAANLCSAVTIKKLGTTGTATREEIVEAWERYNV